MDIKINRPILPEATIALTVTLEEAQIIAYAVRGEVLPRIEVLRKREMANDILFAVNEAK